ncbi:hypothetical protein Avbf_18498 [Armadillidium vulgare]|nr:hypothetical protein Avbf_18498 [Armadillidium vulgare]
MSKEIDYFEVYSERNAFQFEVVISERKQKICKEEHENPNNDVFSLPRFCRHKLVNLFSHNIIYKIFMFPDAFDFPYFKIQRFYYRVYHYNTDSPFSTSEIISLKMRN